jgi:hypothetical protein
MPAEELGEVTQDLDSESSTEASFERRQPSSIIANRRNVIHIEGDHGEQCACVEDVHARVRDALLPPILDMPIMHEYVELTGRRFEAVDGAAFEVALFRCTVREPEGLANANILLDWGV